MTEPTKNICKGKKWSTADVLKYNTKNTSKVEINLIAACHKEPTNPFPECKCCDDCLTCHRSTCKETRPVPEDPRPGYGKHIEITKADIDRISPEPTITRVKHLEQALRYVRSTIIREAADTVWNTNSQTVVDYISEILINDDQGELFNKT